jgi:hypothetical protein
MLTDWKVHIDDIHNIDTSTVIRTYPFMWDIARDIQSWDLNQRQRLIDRIVYAMDDNVARILRTMLTGITTGVDAIDTTLFNRVDIHSVIAYVFKTRGFEDVIGSHSPIVTNMSDGRDRTKLTAMDTALFIPLIILALLAFLYFEVRKMLAGPPPIRIELRHPMEHEERMDAISTTVFPDRKDDRRRTTNTIERVTENPMQRSISFHDVRDDDVHKLHRAFIVFNPDTGKYDKLATSRF